jgi:NADH-quinone oxidoreductase subunit M
VKEESWLTKLKDLSTREILTLVPLAFFAILLGIMPSLVFNTINSSVNQFILLFT